MTNAKKPNINELPSVAQLIKSSVVAVLIALVIIVTVVLPAEYGVDPTRVGQALGLTQMGDIKNQLAQEAERDGHSQLAPSNQPSKNNWLLGLLNTVVPPAQADDSVPQQWTEQVEFVLTPGEGLEIKLRMKRDAQADYMWVANGGLINFDLHADGAESASISYAKGRGVEGDEGTINAAFDGVHGWFWRNRDSQDVTVTLYVRGEFEELVRY